MLGREVDHGAVDAVGSQVRIYMGEVVEYHVSARLYLGRRRASVLHAGLV